MTKILFLLLFIPSQSFAINYFRCDKTDDCSKAYGGCGRYYSVHKRYKELYEAKAKEGDKVANCLAPTELDEKMRVEANPICKKNRCYLSLKKNKGKKAQ